MVNAREARWLDNEKFGAYTRLEPEGTRFEQVGINISVLRPDQPMALYHAEEDQEDFLLLSGSATLLIEGEERELKQWDFVHCPPWTEHIIVGAGAREERRRGGDGEAGENPYKGFPEDHELAGELDLPGLT